MPDQEWSAIARTLIYTRLTNTQPSLCTALTAHVIKPFDYKEFFLCLS